MIAPHSTVCADLRASLSHYLHRRLDPERFDHTRNHLDRCAGCWATWNTFRWDAAAGTPLLAELRSYLGPRFRPYLDSSRALADEWAAANPQTPAQVRAFYAGSENYLYNLAIWHASGNRPNYRDAAAPYLTNSRLILDYGCGIGEDTLALRGQGFEVIACDLPSPATAFLRWRLRRAGQSIVVFDPADLANTATPDTLWIIDTIDHLNDIDHWLAPTLAQVHTVISENLTQARGHGRQGFHLRRPSEAVVATLVSHGLYHHADGPLSVFRRHRAPPRVRLPR